MAKNAEGFLVDLQLRILIRGRIFAGVASPPDGSHACDELANAERFREVVIGAELESGDAVAFRTAGGQHQNRDRSPLRIAPKLTADRQAIEIGQIEIENDEVRLP